MTREKYLEDRKALIDEAQQMIDSSNMENYDAKLGEITALDQRFEDEAKKQANLNALMGSAVGGNMENAAVTAMGSVIGSANLGGSADRTDLLASEEYKSAFLKHMAGRDSEMTQLENEAFVHTTTTTTAPLPTTMLNQIWDLVYGEHHIMEDINIYRTGTIMEVVKHTAIAQGAAKSVAENTANDDEENTFVKVTLSGKDFSKHVDISYAMAAMSLDALEQYLVTEISRGIGEALAEDVVTSIESGIATENKIMTAAAATLTYKECAKLFSMLKRVGKVTVYATRATIYNHLVGMTDATGRPVFQPSMQAGQEGTIFGAVIKVEDAVADDKLLAGDGSKVLYNMIQDVMIEKDRDIKKHVITHSGYARGEGALIDDKAFAELTVKASA